MIYSFDPIINENSKILILGTMPGEESLRKQQYYGHPRNHFWKVIYNLFGGKLEEDYLARKRYLITHSIALWDVLEGCEREGSLDIDIKNPMPNRIPQLLSTYPNVKHLFFNGAKAEALFKKFHKDFYKNNMNKMTRLPSTSPAHTVAFEEKLKQWMKIKEVLTASTSIDYTFSTKDSNV